MPLTRLGKWTVVYGIVGLEVVAGGVYYYYWRRMNSSQGAKRLLKLDVQSNDIVHIMSPWSIVL